MSERDELLKTISSTRHMWALHLEVPAEIVEHVAGGVTDAILAAGYVKPRTITTAEELDALPYGAVVLREEGWGVTVAERQAEDMRWYVTGCLEYIRPEALLPVTVLHEGSQP